jgi:hypothetical protein
MEISKQFKSYNLKKEKKKKESYALMKLEGSK